MLPSGRNAPGAPPLPGRACRAAPAGRPEVPGLTLQLVLVTVFICSNGAAAIRGLSLAGHLLRGHLL